MRKRQMSKNSKNSNSMTTKRIRAKKRLFFILPIIIVLNAVLFAGYAASRQEANLRLEPQGEQFLQRMADHSDVVLWSQVESVRVGTEDGEIFTYVTLLPIELIQGQGRPRFTVRQAGGTLGNITSFSPSGDLPTWREGEEVLAFLLQLENPKYFITGISGKLTAVRSSSGEPVFQVNPRLFREDSANHLLIPKESALKYVRDGAKQHGAGL